MSVEEAVACPSDAAKKVKRTMQELSGPSVESVRSEIQWKMELFRGLEAFCEFCDRSQRSHDARDTISLSETEPVRAEMRQLVSDADRWEPEAEQLSANVSSLQGKFFDVEVGRIQDKFRALHKHFRELATLGAKRVEFLGAMVGFVQLLRSCHESLGKLGPLASSLPKMSAQHRKDFDEELDLQTSQFDGTRRKPLRKELDS